jgi:1,4-dihydroxy-2-naphthoate octaprenyltransferase
MNEERMQRSRSILYIKILLFSASVIPAFIAGAMASGDNNFSILSFFLVLTGLFLGQAAGDYFYYYFTDFHTNTRDSHTKIFAGWKPLFIDTLLRPKDSLMAGIVCLIIDVAILVYFIYQLGSGIIYLAIAGALVALFFTPVMLRGYKEPLIFFTFGPLSMFAAYYALTGEFSVIPVIVSLPVAFLITVVAYLKGAHYKVKEKGSDLVILNINSRHVAWLLLGTYISIILAWIFDFLNPWALISLLSVIPAWLMLRSLKKESTINHYLRATVFSLLIMVFAGLSFTFSFLI